MLVINSAINIKTEKIVSLFIQHIHCDMFRLVIAAIVGYCNNYIKFDVFLTVHHSIDFFKLPT